jgi:hypothetical protein
MIPDNADQIPGSIEDWIGRQAWIRGAACKSVGIATYFSNNPATEEIARGDCQSDLYGLPGQSAFSRYGDGRPGERGIWPAWMLRSGAR